MKNNEKQHCRTVGFMRVKEVLELIPLSRSTWDDGVKSGIFPQPINLTERTVAWRASDINDLIERLSASNDTDGEDAA